MLFENITKKLSFLFFFCYFYCKECFVFSFEIFLELATEKLPYSSTTSNEN